MNPPVRKLEWPRAASAASMVPPSRWKVALCRVAIGAMAMPSMVWAADSAQSQVAGWVASAKSMDPAFAASAERGRVFYNKQSGHNPDMTSCAACHTSNPAGTGKHVVTGKSIAPLSPVANLERFADAAKTEKWFKRNCNDVLGRVCTSAEKADFVSFVQGVK